MEEGREGKKGGSDGGKEGGHKGGRLKKDTMTDRYKEQEVKHDSEC